MINHYVKGLYCVLILYILHFVLPRSRVCMHRYYKWLVHYPNQPIKGVEIILLFYVILAGLHICSSPDTFESLSRLIYFNNIIMCPSWFFFNHSTKFLKILFVVISYKGLYSSVNTLDNSAFILKSDISHRGIFFWFQ